MTAAAMRGVFVTGTDTNVGKTVVSAWLVRALDADYWKPIQAGLDGETDSDVVLRLAGLAPARIHASAYRLEAPLSPHEAARREGVRIDLSRFELPASPRPIVVEGAGGLLVPLDDHALIVDLIARLGLAAVLVARSTLGTINHTLLSLEALRARRIPCLGVVLNGSPNAANRTAIETYGRAHILAELPRLEPLDETAIAEAARRFAPRLPAGAEVPA